jgi:hypothetical protein
MFMESMATCAWNTQVALRKLANAMRREASKLASELGDK